MHSTFELCESSRTESFMCIAIAFPRPRCTRKGRFYGWLVNRSQPTLKLSAIWFSFCKKKRSTISTFAMLSNYRFSQFLILSNIRNNLHFICLVYYAKYIIVCQCFFVCVCVNVLDALLSISKQSTRHN